VEPGRRRDGIVPDGSGDRLAANPSVRSVSLGQRRDGQRRGDRSK
jgi:hypothetical protein